MATPIYNRVVDDIADALRGVSVAAQYHQNFLVSEDLSDMQTPADGLCVVEAGDPEAVDDSPLSKTDWTATVSVYLVAIAAVQVIDERLRTMAADAVKAVMIDERRGGYAVYTEAKSPRTFTVGDGSGAVKGITVDFEVYFRTKRGDPFNV